MKSFENLEDIDLINRFSRKELTDKELEAFEIRMLGDEEFSKTVSSYLAINATAQDLRKQELLDIARSNSNPVNSQNRFWFILPVLLCLGFACYFYLNAKPTVLDQPDIEQIIEREKPNLKIAGSTWRLLLLNGKYEAALDLIEAEIAEITTPCKDEELRYYSGILHLKLQKNIHLAEERLACTISDNISQNFRKDASLYLLVALLQNRKIKEAKNLLEKQKVNIELIPAKLRKLLNE